MYQCFECDALNETSVCDKCGGCCETIQTTNQGENMTIEIPNEISDLVNNDVLIDCYYKNDVSHTFYFVDIKDARLYALHTDGNRREEGPSTGKYLIIDIDTDEILCDTDNLQTALREIKTLVNN